MLTFDISGAQIDGARDYQEDAILITHLGDSDNEGGSLVIVADGMGGHAAGNVASNMAVQTFNKHVTSNFPSDDLAEVLRESVQQANNSIAETVRETAALKGMDCTLVSVVLEDKFIRWVSVGDSHLYLIRNNEMKKKNADHSYGGFLDRMADEGTPVEAEAGSSHNMLMSALTGEDIAEIDCPETALELQSGDRLIIASDGLDTLSEGKVLSFTAETSSIKECVDALLQGVEDAKMPRQDNTTVVIVEVGEKENPARQVAVAASTATETVEVEVDHQAARPRPFAVEEDEPRERGPWLKFVAAGLLLLGVAAGGYWFMIHRVPQKLLSILALPTSKTILRSRKTRISKKIPSIRLLRSTRSQWMFHPRWLKQCPLGVGKNLPTSLNRAGLRRLWFGSQLVGSQWVVAKTQLTLMSDRNIR